jgi:hypothetical protein
MGLSMVSLKRQIYAHRGLWGVPQKNSLQALTSAARAGYSIETDLRDFGASIAISHDPAIQLSEMNFTELISLNSKFALNIKSDGLIPLLPDIRAKGVDYFFFDGSIPELYRYRQAGFNTAVRLSEFELHLPWKTSYIWLDAFETDWWLDKLPLEKYSVDSEIIVVSPELHGRNKSRVWDVVLEEIQRGNTNISICTDFPEEFEACI